MKAILSSRLSDPNYSPPFVYSVLLGFQHVLTMFVANVTPAILIASAAGFGFGSSDFSELLYLIQMSMLFAGITTLFQTVGMGPIGSRLPIVQGTSFAYVSVIIPAMIVAGGVGGLSAVMTAVIIAGLFHFGMGFYLRPLLFAFPPLVTGLIILMIGMALMGIGVFYAAGGADAVGSADYGSFSNWGFALLTGMMIIISKFYFRGFGSLFSILIGILFGYVVSLFLGRVDTSAISDASWFTFPIPFRHGLSFDFALIFAMCLASVISLIETVGDTAAITRSGAGRDATDDEFRGAALADGLGTTISGIFGALPNTSYSENVGVISMTGVMSRFVVSLAGIILIFCGFIPKIGALISTIPIEVLGGAVIIMFGMISSAGINILSRVDWNGRNMFILAVSLSLSLGLQLVPEATAHVSDSVSVLLTSGLLPAAFLAIFLNLIIPHSKN